MALPASGQIAFSDVRTEMSQSARNDYDFKSWATGYYATGIGFTSFTPINVHSDNVSKNDQFNLNRWYSYNRSSTYTISSTARDLYFNINPCNIADYMSSMIVFDAGTSNTTYEVIISGSSNDFLYAEDVAIWYGTPWTNNTGGPNTSNIVWSNPLTGSGLNMTFNLNYTYDSNRGQYLYVVLYSSVALC